MAIDSTADPLAITLGVEEEFFLVDPETRDLMPDPDPRIFDECEKDRGGPQGRGRVPPLPDRDYHPGLLLRGGRPHFAGRDPPPRHRRGGKTRRRGHGRFHPPVRGLAPAGPHGRTTIRTVRNDLPAGRPGTAGRRHAHPRGFRRPRQPRTHHDGYAPLYAAAPRVIRFLSLQQRKGDRLQVLPAYPLRQLAAHGSARAAALLGGIREPGRRIPKVGVHPGQQRAVVGYPSFPGLPHPGTADLRHLPGPWTTPCASRRFMRVSCDTCFGWT